MGYSENPGHVRIDFFKPDTSKWYMEEMLDMSGEYNAPHAYAAVRNALATTRHGRLAEKRWLIVVLKPYHVNAHPVMLSPGLASYEPWPVASESSKTFMGEEPADGLWNLADWSAMYHIRVTDADGWRIDGTDPVRALISQDEFFTRVSTSTIQDLSGGQFAEEMAAWKKRRS